MVLLVNELGEVIGKESDEVAHNPANPLLHLSILVLLTHKNKIGIIKRDFDDVFPLKYDFYMHLHVKENMDKEINALIQSKSWSSYKLNEFIYLSHYKDMFAEHEYAKVIIVDTQQKDAIYLSPQHITQENSTPRLYTFIRYVYPQIVDKDTS